MQTRSVGQIDHPLDSFDRPTRLGRPETIGVDRTPRLDHVAIHIAQRLANRDAEQQRGRRIEMGDPSVLVDGNDADRQRIENTVEKLGGPQIPGGHLDQLLIGLCEAIVLEGELFLELEVLALQAVDDTGERRVRLGKLRQVRTRLDRRQPAALSIVHDRPLFLHWERVDQRRSRFNKNFP